MKVFQEKMKSDFEGTIIDLETTGDFQNFDDSRQYAKHQPTAFGFINSKGLEIFCAKNDASIKKLNIKMLEIIPKLERPFYAYNSIFEMGVLFHSLNKKILFDRELNQFRREKKTYLIQNLGIPSYEDPFSDGFQCLGAWKKGEIEKIIAHNRADLLQERDILKLRGFRKPDEIKFVKAQ